MKNAPGKILIVFAAIALALGSHTLWLPLPARFLTVRDDIGKAGAVVILSGDWCLDREAKAVELHKEGLANKIIRVLERDSRKFDAARSLFNSNAAQKEVYVRYFEERGIPADAIIMGEAVATSTFDELGAARRIALEDGLDSIIIVTSDYHMRRALMSARWVFRNDNIKVYNASVYSKRFNPGRWWLHEEDIKGVVLEYLSIFFYLSYHFMLGK